MNLVEMQTSFHDHTSSLTSDLTDTQVDAYLNRAFQYTIPLDVGGEFSEAIWVKTLTPDVKSYALPAPVVSARGDEPWIDSVDTGSGIEQIGIVYLTFETDPVVFKRKYLSRQSSGRPTAALFYGKVMLLSAPPSKAYVISVPVRSGPLSALNAGGIDHGTHAQAVVAAAAVDYLTEIEDINDPGAIRESGRYSRFKSQLQSYALARPTVRRYTRSF